MMVAPRLEADFYLFGYNIAAYKRYYSYWKDYDYERRDENDVIQRAALYHLAQMRDGFKRASEDLALELGIRFSDIVPEHYDPQLEAMNELDGEVPLASSLEGVSVKSYMPHSSRAAMSAERLDIATS